MCKVGIKTSPFYGTYGRPCKVCGIPTGVAHCMGGQFDDSTAICEDCYNTVYVKDKQLLLLKIEQLHNLSNNICNDKLIQLVKQIQECI